MNAAHHADLAARDESRVAGLAERLDMMASERRESDPALCADLREAAMTIRQQSLALAVLRAAKAPGLAPDIPAAKAQPVQDEREAFESWALTYHQLSSPGPLARMDGNGRYFYGPVNACWEAWQARAALAAAPAPAPQGWKLVPVEPTEDMLFGAEMSKPRGYRDLWAAMLAATPPAPALYVGLIERLMRLSTRLGIAHEGGVEHFAAGLEDRLYAICRSAESLIDSLAATPAPARQPVQDLPLTQDEIDGIYAKYSGDGGPTAICELFAPALIRTALAATPAPAPQLPPFIRAEVERAIAKAAAPTGMSTHDGKALIGHDKLRYMLALIDKLAATPAPAQQAVPLTDAQIAEGRYRMWAAELEDSPEPWAFLQGARWAQRACAEAWGVKLAGIGAITKESNQ